MPIYALNEQLVFPSPERAEPPGILAIGGDLSVERLLLAYRHGIFPWYSEDEPITWWSPDVRAVLYPADLKVKSGFLSSKFDIFYSVINPHYFTTILMKGQQHCSHITTYIENDRIGRQGDIFGNKSMRFVRLL